MYRVARLFKPKKSYTSGVSTKVTQCGPEGRNFNWSPNRSQRNVMLCVEQAGDAATMSTLAKCRALDPALRQDLGARDCSLGILRFSGCCVVILNRLCKGDLSLLGHFSGFPALRMLMGRLGCGCRGWPCLRLKLAS